MQLGLWSVKSVQDELLSFFCFRRCKALKEDLCFCGWQFKANASHEDNWKTKYNHLEIASYNHSWFVLATWGGGDCGEIYSNMILSSIFQLLKVPTLLIFWWYIMICDNIIIITELGGPQQADVHAGLLPHSVSSSYFARSHCLHKV